MTLAFCFGISVFLLNNLGIFKSEIINAKYFYLLNPIFGKFLDCNFSLILSNLFS
jgi:hypothetical protein